METGKAATSPRGVPVRAVHGCFSFHWKALYSKGRLFGGPAKEYTFASASVK